MSQTKEELVRDRRQLYLTGAITSMVILPFAIMFSYPLAIVPFVIVWVLIGFGLNLLGLEVWFMEIGFLITYGACCAMIGYYAFIWPMSHYSSSETPRPKS